MALLDLDSIFEKSISYKNKCEYFCNLVTDNSKKVTENISLNQCDNIKSYEVTKVTKQNQYIGKNVFWLDLFEERAAIMEYDGGLSRIDAEVGAFNELVYKFCEVNDCNDTDFAVSALLALGLKNPYHKAEYKQQ